MCLLMANCDYDLAKQRQSLAGTLNVVFVCCILCTPCGLLHERTHVVSWFNWVFKRSQLAMNVPGSSWVNTGFCQDVAHVALVMVVWRLPAPCSVRLGLTADGLSSGRCVKNGGWRDDMWWYVMNCDELWWYVMICDDMWSYLMDVFL